MAVLLGNLGLLLDPNPPRIVLPDRKTRQGTIDLVSNSPKRDPILINLSTIKLFEFEAENRNSRIGKRKSNSKANAVDYDNGSSDEENNNGDNKDWENEMRKRVKEIQEMKELEKRAEELQSRVEEGEEETEEEKKNRVRKELEKIQIWLAMAYEANNRHGDCIALYKQLEMKHPSVTIRRQAAELRYILQAPKLKISQDEMVTIPLIGSSYDSYAGSWSDKYKDRSQSSMMVTTNQLPSTKDYLGDFLVWRPPSGWEKNQTFWLALIFWLGLVGVALFIQR
ncbi:tetratricopeptide repeat (TPR)-like superfamily protein isoform X2 [Tasmannia lanceolata]|uniref:tetratricopeptide repeat (TPR)-like superfamily protein isoform X2 n=1 Tax=Tasmannia lanceolata TaxID=3420 RepID=UPI004064BD51